MMHVLDDMQEEAQKRFPNEIVSVTLLENIADAAKSSHNKRLLALLNDIQNEDFANYLVNLKYDDLDGQSLTPLGMAAMTGNVALMKTLISKYKIDLEAECNVIFDGMVAYGATALWLSAGMGHLQAVKLLVQNGASVNHNTKAQSSPLRAACYEGRLDIVKYLIEHGADVNLANAYNNTCIMIAAYRGHNVVVDTLLKYGAHPNEQALCGLTALHYAAEAGHLHCCHLLLKHGATLLKNELNLTAVLLAADRTHENIVKLFIESELMSTEEIITALELLGASFANDKDNYNLDKAYRYLCDAMELRYANPSNIIRKQPLAPVPAYDDWFETENMAELRAIRLNHHSLHMEALTIRERILGKNYPDLAQAIVYRGAVMADQGRFSQCMALWHYAIDLRMMNNISVERDLLRFSQLFSQILRIERHPLSISMVLSVLSKCQQEITNNRIKIQNPGPKDSPQLLKEQNDQNLYTALYLIKIITKVTGQQQKLNSNSVTKEIIDELYRILVKLVKCDIHLMDGQTLLHLAVNGVSHGDDFHTNDVCRFPCYRTAMILVHVGASVDAIDKERNTPLHTLMSTFPRADNTQSLKEAEKIIKLFVDAGVHLDAVNEQGLTAINLSPNVSLSGQLLCYQNSNITLKCLASRTIAANKIAYESRVPRILEPYIQMHSTDKYC